LREPTRANVIITERPSPNGRVRQLRFNPLGPKLSRAEWNSFLESTKRLLPRASCLVLSGSLPRGIPATAYAQLIRLARSAGIKTLLDCDGEAFAAAAKARPFLVKPNEHELAEWSGKSLGSESAILRAARDLSETTRGWVLISRGPRRSFLLHHNHPAIFSARPHRVTPMNTVGAGDALLAAVTRQILLGAPPEDWLRWGIAAGTAATQCLPGILPSPAVIHRCFRQVISHTADL
jgi:1-phosphofructokinase family hexose kinase